jgi:hypothetical protein
VNRGQEPGGHLFRVVSWQTLARLALSYTGAKKTLYSLVLIRQPEWLQLSIQHTNWNTHNNTRHTILQRSPHERGWNRSLIFSWCVSAAPEMRCIHAIVSIRFAAADSSHAAFAFWAAKINPGAMYLRGVERCEICNARGGKLRGATINHKCIPRRCTIL